MARVEMTLSIDKQSKGDVHWVDIPWRSVFTDPQLQSIIEKGLNNNVNLLNAALNVKMAEEKLTPMKFEDELNEEAAAELVQYANAAHHKKGIEKK